MEAERQTGREIDTMTDRNRESSQMKETHFEKDYKTKQTSGGRFQ